MKSTSFDVHALPVLPEIADAVIRMALDEEVTVAKIADLIEKDQALTVRILELANSSFYRRSRQIHTVKEAVVLIGAEAVRTLVLGISVMEIFPDRQGSRLDHRAFWRHCLGSALYAEEIMGADNHALGAKAFCAGLLHDVGKLVLESVRPDEYGRVLEQAREGLRPLDAIEREILGLSHADAGRDVLAHWKLPGIYEETVWCHHEPVLILDDDQYRVSGAVHVANALAHMSGMGSSGNFFPQAVPEALLKSLALGDERLDHLVKAVPAKLDRICEDIGLGKDSPGIFSLVNKAGARLAQTAIRLQQDREASSSARSRSEILVSLLKELNDTSRVTDALTRATEALFRAGIVKGFIGGLAIDGGKLVYERRLETGDRFIKLTDAEAKALVNERGYAAGVSLPSGIFVYLDLVDAACFDDHDFVVSIVASIAAALRRIQAETALGREKNRLREALVASSRERRKVEELMELNRELVEASVVGLCLVDANLRVRIENPESARLRKLIGLGGVSLGEEGFEGADEGAGALKDAVARGEAFSVVVESRGRSVRCSAQPVARSRMTLLILEDITSELDEQRRTLAYAKMSVVGSLAASMAHNMKSPIGAIHGFANMIREDLRLGRITVRRGDAEDKDLPDMLANIVTASENLLKIVNQLLNFTRKWESPVVEVRLDEFVTNAFMLLEAQANNAGVTLVNEAEPVTARLKADALEQVLINILMNAVTASPRGAGVTVKAALKGDGVEVAVSDRGIGMTEEQASRVFDPLYSSWPMKTGMGLGLSLARQIVESLGGTIEVSSKLAQGTTFTVWIPQGVAE